MQMMWNAPGGCTLTMRSARVICRIRGRTHNRSPGWTYMFHASHTLAMPMDIFESGYSIFISWSSSLQWDRSDSSKMLLGHLLDQFGHAFVQKWKIQHEVCARRVIEAINEVTNGHHDVWVQRVLQAIVHVWHRGRDDSERAG